MDNPILTFFLDYWNTKRADQPLPMHRGFVPREISKYLPWVVTVDALPDYSDFRRRVVGSNVCRYFLHNGTGKTVREAFAEAPHEIAEETIELFRHACRHKVPSRLTGPSGNWNDIHFPNFDALNLPYASDGETDRGALTFNYAEFLTTRSPGLLAG